MLREPTSQELTDFFGRIMDYAIKGDFVTMNRELEELSVKNSATIWLVGYLRYTYKFRKYLIAWPSLFEAAKKEIEARGENVDAILGGLDV